MAASPEHILIRLQAGRRADDPALAFALHRLHAQVLMRLPETLIVQAPAGLREAIAALPGVLHAGGVQMPARAIRRTVTTLTTSPPA